MMKKKRERRFPLLIYQRWSNMLYLPSLLIVILSGISWWIARQSQVYRGQAWALLVIGIIGLAIFVYARLIRYTAYVQCTPNFIKIRTPLAPVVVSYARLLQVHPHEFHEQLASQRLNRSQRRLLEPFLRNTALVLDLKEYPLQKKTLRLWLNDFMFVANAKGLVLLVEDWQALSDQISARFERWLTPRQQQQQRIQNVLRRRYPYS
jgi:hypothetical protein